MVEMAVAVPTTAVATGVCLVGEVRGARGGRISQGWRGRHAEELGQKEVEPQPSFSDLKQEPQVKLCPSM